MRVRKPLPRSRQSGLRATAFGDLVFMDHCEVTMGKSKGLVLLILDGASSLLWASAQPDSSAAHTLATAREWMDQMNCRLITVVADMAFFHRAV